MNKLLVAVAFLSVVVLGFGSFLAWQFFKVDTKQVSQIPTISPTPSPISNLKKIAYVKNNAIWLTNSDGSEKKELGKSPGEANIEQVAWKNSEIISYLQCLTNCAIITSNIQNYKPVVVVSYDGRYIISHSWNHAGDQLAYIYSLPDGQMKLNLKSGDVGNTIKNFFAGPGRGGSLDDDVSIHFSPDDKYILVTNTLTVGNPQDKNTIWVLEADSGKEVLAIPISDSGWPTQASWLDSETFVYKEGDSLYHEDLEDTLRFFPNASIPNFYNPTTFNNNEVYYWVDTNILPYIGLLNSSGKTTKLIEGFFKPVRNSDQIIALKAEEVGVAESIMSFKSSGLSSIDIKNNIKDLDSGEINLFAISP